MTAQPATARCYFIPPHVQASLDEERRRRGRRRQPEGLSDSARKRRSAAIDAAGRGRRPSPWPRAPTGTGRREVYDSATTTNQRVTLVRPEGSPETKDVEVINAYDSAGVVRSYFRQVLNRDSIDNRALDLVLNVHYGAQFNNAFWDGDEMTFGDGDGVIFSGFARSLDVVAHELAHGVTQYAAGLVYQDESGALNEHFSDVFGTAITQWVSKESPEDADWLIGDEIMGPDLYGEALRSMRHPGTAYDNPILGKDPQPAHYADRYTGSARQRGRAHQLGHPEPGLLPGGDRARRHPGRGADLVPRAALPGARRAPSPRPRPRWPTRRGSWSRPAWSRRARPRSCAVAGAPWASAETMWR